MMESIKKLREMTGAGMMDVKKALTDADGNDAPASGCGYQYRHVTDGAVTSRLGILWRVTWTGTGGTGGTLPTMETITAAPLRVLQMQVVNR